MSLNVKVKPQIHNRFDIWKENVETGVKEQVGYAENIVLDAMWPRLCGGSTYFVNIHYGIGEGTLSPARTSLFSYLGTGVASTVETVRAVPTSYWRRSITLGLTTANGNTLTEVGIARGSSSSTLVTHAQIRDMNGNPTGIAKTDVDIITIYATVYVTLINDHPSIKLVHPNSNGLLSYLLGGGFPSAVFNAGTNTTYHELPDSLGSASIGSSASGSWSADTENKKRKSSTMRFNTGVANGHIKELLFSNIARLMLPDASIYSGLELSDVPIGIGNAEVKLFSLPSLNIKQDSIVLKEDGVPVDIIKYQQYSIISDKPTPTGNYPAVNSAGGTFSGSANAFSPNGNYFASVHGAMNNNSGLAMYKNNTNAWTRILPPVSGGDPFLTSRTGTSLVFSPDSSILAISTSASPFIHMYKNIAGVWTKMPNVTGGNPTGAGNGIAFSPDGTVFAIAHSTSPYITMYKNIEGVWTKMENVTGGYPTGNGRGVAFSPDGTAFAIAHESSPFITMYKNIESVWTKMENVTGDNPTGTGNGIAFSPDGTVFVIAHSTAPYVTLYKNVAGVWTKMENVTGGNPTGTGNGIAFFPDGTAFAIAHENSPYVTLYKNIEGVWTKMGTVLLSILNHARHISILNDTVAVSLYKSMLRMYDCAKNYTYIVCSTPPAEGAVITADYTVNGIHKTDQRVIDVSGEIQFGEPT